MRSFGIERYERGDDGLAGCERRLPVVARLAMRRSPQHRQRRCTAPTRPPKTSTTTSSSSSARSIARRSDDRDPGRSRGAPPRLRRQLSARRDRARHDHASSGRLLRSVPSATAFRESTDGHQRRACSIFIGKKRSRRLQRAQIVLGFSRRHHPDSELLCAHDRDGRDGRASQGDQRSRGSGDRLRGRLALGRRGDAVDRVARRLVVVSAFRRTVSA